MRTALRLLVATATALALLACVALAAVPVGAYYDGTSSHHRYGVRVITECFTSGCRRVTTIAVQVTTGSASHPNARCVYQTGQLADAKLRKGRAFVAKGTFLAHGRTFEVTVTGKFTSAHTVKGKVTGPKACGGTQTYKAVLTPGG